MRIAAVLLALCLAGCGLFPAPLAPCARLESLQKEYFDELVAGCSEYATFKECPDYAAIKAKHDARMKEAACRY